MLKTFLNHQQILTNLDESHNPQEQTSEENWQSQLEQSWSW